ncbi:Sulfoacetaldehyde acetyltransferase [Variovorax sp. PBS-H4]|uniref:thiamine pyrophosphate-binding protein n=1 Tax=Variovorax sp. PBS-H4 TaxID=434008 RepID=UPI001315F7E1|nr:thiamine pyrophosphate-binding protein [Variovorax sp. PBS-H4]VTU34377.1 Sulfoacetaldehyde acetyltransferase [Variovorax sp. PBS-H4]
MTFEAIEKPEGERAAMSWTSDVAAEMLKRLGIEYIALNPGASYRGLHDSLVNYLGNRNPQMLLCLNEDHVLSIAHGYAKASDKMMACALHSNVGLMHGLMGIFNAWCDRVPMLILGATGPVAVEKRRPWIDWIHTTKDQGALLRHFTKWDDEPRSAPSIVEGMLRAAQLSLTPPCAPTYVCLDSGLQEEALTKEVAIPDVSRYAPMQAPGATAAQLERAASILLESRSPVLLMGRGERGTDAWARRVRFAELLGARVLTSIRERAIFPTAHPLHAAPPIQWMSPQVKAIVASADTLVGLDWPELNGTLLQVSRDTGSVCDSIINVTMDSTLHNGWSMDYFGLPPVDLAIMSTADTFIGQLLPIIEARTGGQPRWKAGGGKVEHAPQYSESADIELQPRDVEVALAKLRGRHEFTLAHVPLGWAGDVFHFRHPLDFLGHDGGGGIGAGPGLTVGAALALRGTGRIVLGILGDGDFIQGATALWTAAHYEIPALFIISNNRSNFNDEVHQEAVAKMRGREVDNRWIGQRIDNPKVDLCALAKAQGVASSRPVGTAAELEAEIARGLDVVAGGQPYLIDARVATGYANPPLSRGAD